MSPVDWLDVDNWGGKVHEAGGPASQRHEDDGGPS